MRAGWLMLGWAVGGGDGGGGDDGGGDDGGGDDGGGDGGGGDDGGDDGGGRMLGARVVGAFLAARASRCRVMALRPMRMCWLMSGGGGGASGRVVDSSLGSGLVICRSADAGMQSAGDGCGNGGLLLTIEFTADLLANQVEDDVLFVLVDVRPNAPR
ncbi:predicted protein [Plenodomus lingam JN3]|uniref:Predicted protein n=1 Tax=Leptosphaeria maculans (strain JN3 / isolate v23.1.3 / race Av1-4-5-6-7-8) TaxID=985895 RepID=E5A1J2_LEPMJ|nr:predicted protein [Plenodomus lingam JN3]CBX97456.1 predicted protein [Plenodomus lingam JN3]